MAFYEAQLGETRSTGITTTARPAARRPDGLPTIYRTAQEAAQDIERYGADTAAIRQSGGLLDQEKAFQYSVAKGRMKDLEAQIVAHEREIARVQKTIEDRVNELARLGAMSIADIGLKIGQLGIAKLVPGIGWTMLGLEMFGVDLFGQKKKKKKKAEIIVRHLEQLAARLKWLVGRIDVLNAEGHVVSQAFERGPTAFKVAFAPLAQKTTKGHKAVGYDADGVPVYQVTHTISDVKDTYLRAATELEERATTLTPTGARLPVGFQQVYSPALANQSIVAKIETKTPEGQPIAPLLTKRAVYGGLAGVGETRPEVVFMYTVLGVSAMFAYLVATEPASRPSRRRAPLYRWRRVG